MEVFYEGIIEAAQKDPYMLLCYLFFFSQRFVYEDLYPALLQLFQPSTG